MRTRVGHASVTWATCNKLSHLITLPLTSSVVVAREGCGGEGDRPETSIQPLLRAPDVIRIVCGCRHACWDSIVILTSLFSISLI